MVRNLRGVGHESGRQLSSWSFGTPVFNLTVKSADAPEPHYHGAYYYQVPPGLEKQWDGRKQFRLGVTLGEAATEWAKRMSASERSAVWIRELLERYALEVIPTKAAATQRGDNLALVNLRKIFGDMRLIDLEPRHIYKYVDTRLNNKLGQKRWGGPGFYRYGEASVAGASSLCVSSECAVWKGILALRWIRQGGQLELPDHMEHPDLAWPPNSAR